jgi:hypothetical protein
VEFNAQMSNEDILKTLKPLLPNQFKEPLEVTAEFAEGHLTPPEDADPLNRKAVPAADHHQ